MIFLKNSNAILNSILKYSVVFLALTLNGLASAESLSWQAFQMRVKEQASVIQIEQLDSTIATAGVKVAKTKYLPQISIQANSERLDTLTSQPLNTVGTPNVGNTNILNRDAFQNVAILDTRWTVLDFGKRKAEVEQNKALAQAEKFDADNKAYRLLLSILPTYAQAWKWQQELELQKAQRRLLEQRLDLVKRLYEAGKVGKIMVLEAELKAINTTQTIQRLEMSILEAFQRLQQETQVKLLAPYPTLQLSTDIENPSDASHTDLAHSLHNTLDANQVPFVKELESRIQQKEEELKQVQRQRWTPDLSVYGTLVAFGTDPSSLPEGLSDVTWRNGRLGVSLQMPVTQAYALKFTQEKLELEKKRLELQKAGAIWEATETISQLAEQKKILALKQAEINEAEATQKQIEEAVKRLNMQRVLTPLEALDVQIRGTQQRLERLQWQADQWVLQEKKQLLQASLTPVEAPLQSTPTTHPLKQLWKKKESAS